MALEKQSPCKVNLLLNILGKRPDGYHELETIMIPVGICDRMVFQRASRGIELTCSDPLLPRDSKNLAYRAAALFLKTAAINEGTRIHLEKRLPIAAGLGGGSANAAVTFGAMNELFGQPLAPAQLTELAASLGSDIPFFLQTQPALATGRGEVVAQLENFRALEDAWVLLVHPGFGISTPWAYQQLARFPEALNGKAGRARRLISLLQGSDLTAAGAEFYNSLEAPALYKYPLLSLYQSFFRENGAAVTLMSGSGSATFALVRSQAAAAALQEKFKSHFGDKPWTAIAPIS